MYVCYRKINSQVTSKHSLIFAAMTEVNRDRDLNEMLSDIIENLKRLKLRSLIQDRDLNEMLSDFI